MSFVWTKIFDTDEVDQVVTDAMQRCDCKKFVFLDFDHITDYS